MEFAYGFAKILLAISIIHVWSINVNKPSRWRGGDAKTMWEEFQAYGLSRRTMYMVGTFKVFFALLLIVSLFYTGIGHFAALGLAIFLCGSIYMHIKIKDPWIKSLPAAFFLLLALFIAFTTDDGIVHAFVLTH